MDILERLLRHDAWTTRQILLRCQELTDAQLDQHFDIGHESVRATLLHIIGNMEVWTDLMRGRLPRLEAPATAPSVAHLRARLDAAALDLAELSLRLAGERRLDARWTDTLDDPPRPKTYGGAIAHVLTHSHVHRGEVLHMLARLGLRDLPEGDVLSWEAAQPVNDTRAVSRTPEDTTRDTRCVTHVGHSALHNQERTAEM